jgi:hypothetical protein
MIVEKMSIPTHPGRHSPNIGGPILQHRGVVNTLHYNQLKLCNYFLLNFLLFPLFYIRSCDELIGGLLFHGIILKAIDGYFFRKNL